MALTKVTNDLLATPPTDYDDSGIQTDIALLGFKVAANGSLAAYNLQDQFVDAFEDASGVDASASTGENRSGSNYYFGGTAGNATGGTITTSGSNTIHTFNTAGNGSSTNDFVTPSSGSVDYLVVAGGGGGGNSAAGGGGGGGGVRTGTGFSVSAQTYAIVAGAGATAIASSGNRGSNSSFSTISATGGGGGAIHVDSANISGGSGGGGSYDQTGWSGSGNAGGYSPVEGYDGGQGGQYSGGGGGGASEVGESMGGTSGQQEGGDGGDGVASSITGASVTYGGGGGGATHSSSTGTYGNGGAGGGGNGAKNGTGVDGTDGLGGGGGGSSNNNTGSAGGNGVVVIAYTTNSFISPGGDMTLVSNASTAEATPTTGDIVMTYTNGAGTATVNTDLKAYVSRDNGTTWTQATLSSEGTTGGHTILTAHNVDISGQPSGTSMRYKIETLNQSASKETRIQAVSLGWA